MMPNCRIQWIDAAKCIGILMVAFGHNWLHSKFCYYFYAFHMPLFFILAGITFSTKSDFKTFIRKKSKTLLLPYAFFAICIIAFYGLLKSTHEGGYNWGGELKAFILQKRHTLLWFLSVLFFSEIFTYLILRLIKSNKALVLISIAIILLIIHFLLNHYGFNNFIWNLDMVPLASSFIIIGVLYRRHNHKILLENNLWYVGSLLVFSIVIITYNYYHSGEMVDLPGNSFGNYPLFVSGALAATYFLILVLKKVSLPQWMIYIGVYSIIFYGFHRFIIELIFISYGKLGISFDKDNWSGVILSIFNVLITIAALYPISIFINKKCPWLLGKF